jgi:hypothetical protein
LTDHRDGSWQGFKEVDLDVTIDLGDTLSHREVSTGFLQNPSAWIFYPRVVEYSLSRDGKKFTPASIIANQTPDSTAGTIRREFTATLPVEPFRFLRVKAPSIGKCPPWHPGRGLEAWLFADEIRVK